MAWLGQHRTVYGRIEEEDATAYLALLGCVNDANSLERLLAGLAEELWATGCRRVIGPTGLSPHLGSGALQDHWSDLPPLHTPYNPPYLPEIVTGNLRPLARSRLFHADVPADISRRTSGPAELVCLDPSRLATKLLPLLQAACPSWAGFAVPDRDEAAFVLRWLEQWPLYGWLAQVDNQPAGFVLLQPDLAPRLRRANSGRNPLWRLWLIWTSRHPARKGRLIFGGVLARAPGARYRPAALAPSHGRRPRLWLGIAEHPFPWVIQLQRPSVACSAASGRTATQWRRQQQDPAP